MLLDGGHRRQEANNGKATNNNDIVEPAEISGNAEEWSYYILRWLLNA